MQIHFFFQLARSPQHVSTFTMTFVTEVPDFLNIIEDSNDGAPNQHSPRRNGKTVSKV